ncbi:hypothetical protein KIN20_016270 [Parelaphostrongylus tenuis]|uniref:Uncharacterized protein n=1 Tax=Parelaphostrongylus tenuis TaxID=148309 RepID=A0AAD5QQL5_PARTN|nr:hypothetical protein KIN20_016270 [Parelaphostrongylus tenuis]
MSHASVKDEILFISLEEHNQPLSAECSWMRKLRKFKKPLGPKFPDGSINWQCPCMAGGSLVAHRCGHLFRPSYICMDRNDKLNANIKCADEFADWAACIREKRTENRGNK